MKNHACPQCGFSMPIVEPLDILRPDLMARAESLARLVAAHPELARSMGAKKLQCNGMLSFRLNHKYRMIVAGNSLVSGPYLVMGHGRYDQLLARLR